MHSSPTRRRSKRNLGETSAKRRKRSEDPMLAYDQLPRDLRLWIQSAKLPWSPASCRRVWLKTKARGDSLEQTLASLDRAEAATLARGGRSNGVSNFPG
ncbi:DUF6525 family protein [Pseudophaeobacter sp. EL27]|uniref:DUF6525 family protein n=1 Tax=Pseudophaeobacter sp. EL27 TaxID=2107580 RepID=UPI000EFB9576|nr:DUF6525 family protein [Pseudophaeobacter sp. EL27]